MTQVKNARDPRVKRTRLLIQNALVSLLGETEFESITVQEIAERATVNRATFYAHYEDKYDLVYSVVRGQFHLRLAAEVPDTSPVTTQTLETLCATVLAFFTDSYGHCNLDRQLGSMLEKAMNEELHVHISKWLRQMPGDSTSGKPDIDITAMIISSALIGAGLKLNRGKCSLADDQTIEQIVSVLANGMLAVPPKPDQENGDQIRIRTAGIGLPD